MLLTPIQRWAYRNLARPVFFRCDAERVHEGIIRFGRILGRRSVTRRLVRSLYTFSHPALRQRLAGLEFPNPVGLAAGFDKNGLLTRLLPEVGFGFSEAGSVTGEPCSGNGRPRLWRLPQSRGLVVYYGLVNDGCETIADRLADRPERPIPLGVSVAKTNSPDTVETEAGIADYAKAFAVCAPVADYLTVNISCPNAFGGEPFGTPERLDRLLTALDGIPTERPVFLKMAADLQPNEAEELARTASRHRVHGLIMSNLTKRRDHPAIDRRELDRVGPGGLSGPQLHALSNRLIAHLYRTFGERFVLVGCGGIFTAEEAYEKIRLGASLVQLITGMIYEGPQLIGEINRGLVRLLEHDGFRDISEAVGSAHRPRMDGAVSAPPT
ncbi:hypothetical protein AMJ57_00810 [Parcubacteria bacterium SG8_24]|nr:MAG: hypothetical protein AMJ57_00810 [Parcubacteria bacterium SG8_24]